MKAYAMLEPVPRRKEGSVLVNDALNTFSYGYMASDMW